MSNVRRFPPKDQQPDAVDNANIHALYLAAPPTPQQLRALCKLGFEEYQHNVLAIRPKGMTHEECQAIISATKRPLIPVETDTINSWDEIEAWLIE